MVRIGRLEFIPIREPIPRKMVTITQPPKISAVTAITPRKINSARKNSAIANHRFFTSDAASRFAVAHRDLPQLYPWIHGSKLKAAGDP
jgi:hypothetical protein